MWPRVLIVLAVLVHASVVWSIAAQPLGVNDRPAAERSVIWPLHNDTIHREGPGADFFSVYRAGQELSAGRSPYGNVDEPRTVPYAYPFRYLPVVGKAVALTLGWAPAGTAHVLWIVVLEAGLALLLLTFARATTRAWLRTFAVVVLLLSSPYFLELHMGQFTFLTAALLGCALLVRGRAGRAVTYAASVLLKVFPLVVVPALARERRFWLALALAALALVVTSAPYFAAHPADWSVFVEVNISSPEGGLHSGNHGLVYLLHLVARDGGIDAVVNHWPAFVGLWRIVLLVASTLLVLWSRGDRVVLGAVTLMLAHFCSFLEVWEHHMSAVLVTGLLLLWSLEHEQPSPRPRARLVVIVAVVLLALPTPFVLFDRAADPSVWDPSGTWGAHASWLIVASKALPTVVLLAAAIDGLRRAGWRRLPWPLPVRARA